MLTVVMPVRNEAACIARSLAAVLGQDYPAERLEVIVADGMSTDGTREVVQALQRQHPNLQLIDNPVQIVPAGLNAAIAQAKGEIVMRVDGHCEIAPDYARRCLEALRRTGADNVGGVQRAVSEGWIGQAIALATTSPFGVGGARFHYAQRPGWVDTVYLGAYPRRVFQRIGGFDEELVRNQDDELNFRLLQAGGRIWLDPSIRVIYHSRPTLRRLWQQYLEYGLYKVRVMQKRRAVASPRHLVPAAFVFGLGATLCASILARAPLLALAVAGPYVVANLAASLWTARRSWRSLLVLPLAFATMHVSYGLGFFLGLWRWRHRFKRGINPALAEQQHFRRTERSAVVKRVLDVFSSLLGLLILLPPFALIALAIKLDSPGPVFYRATRIGKDGRPFTMYKFRTMAAGAERRGPAITAGGDQRITHVGRWLRQSKVDELPQLLNVLRGEMSLVGPRPEDPRYVALYTPAQRAVLSLRPGITSLAAVKYRHEEKVLADALDLEAAYRELMQEKLALDLEYVRRRSFWLDLKLIWATVVEVVR